MARIHWDKKNIGAAKAKKEEGKLWDQTDMRQDASVRAKHQLEYANFKQRLLKLCSKIELELRKLLAVCPKGGHDKIEYTEFFRKTPSFMTMTTSEESKHTFEGDINIIRNADRYPASALHFIYYPARKELRCGIGFCSETTTPVIKPLLQAFKKAESKFISELAVF